MFLNKFFGFRKKKKPLTFDDAAKFNLEIDTNAEMKEALAALSLRYPDMTEYEYKKETLCIYNRAGLELSEQELEKLLCLRKNTDQMLLSRKK